MTWPRVSAGSGGGDQPGVSVVICAYAQHRWQQTRAAVKSVTGQIPGPREILLVIDHDAELAVRARRELGNVTVLENDGARIHPRWPASRPRWLPPEFDCALGRTASQPRGREETVLAIRLTARHPRSSVVYVPAASVDHHVASERTRFRYFVRRCWHEGQSKAYVVCSVGPGSGLDRERRYLTSVIPGALVRDLRQLLAGHPRGLLRMTCTVAGVLATVGGYLAGRARFRLHPAAAGAARWPG